MLCLWYYNDNYHRNHRFPLLVMFNNYDLSTNKLLYKDLFMMLIHEILSYQSSETQLIKVRIKNNNSLHFVFKVTENILIYDNPTFIRCKIWGVVNNIQIKMLVNENTMIISCLMENNPLAAVEI